MQFVKAQRKAAPMLIGLYGVSGSGKTFGALLLAAGLVGNGGRVGFIDTENGRGAIYCDSPGIMAALPNGYEIAQLDPPFSPDAYIDAINAAEQAGINVLVIDSLSHEYEGTGGICDIAENNKIKGMPNWMKAKMAHKKFLNRCLSSNMHIIFCLRARDKVKVVKIMKDGREKEEFVPIGIMAIAEKNFVFELLLSLRIDESTHHAQPVKVPEPLMSLFPGSKLLTKEDGVRIREWNATGQIVDPIDRLRQRAKLAASDGLQAYSAFFNTLTPVEKKSIIDTDHETNKSNAKRVDDEAAMASREPDPSVAASWANAVGEQPDGALAVPKE